jgi:tripeptide aminopeptidase
MPIDAEDLLERFCRYVRIETRSDAHGAGTPSTPCQWNLLRLLERELREIGAAGSSTCVGSSGSVIRRPS